MKIYGTKESNKKIAITKFVKPFMTTEIIAFYSQEDEFIARQYAELKQKSDRSVGMVYMTDKEIAELLNPSQETIDEYDSQYRAWCD